MKNYFGGLEVLIFILVITVAESQPQDYTTGEAAFDSYDDGSSITRKNVPLPNGKILHCELNRSTGNYHIYSHDPSSYIDINGNLSNKKMHYELNSDAVMKPYRRHKRYMGSWDNFNHEMNQFSQSMNQFGKDMEKWGSDFNKSINDDMQKYVDMCQFN